MDLRKWIPLWSKCKELEPGCLSWNDEAFDYWTVYDDCGEFQTDHDAPIVAALIRDKAVWWLASKALETRGPDALCLYGDDACTWEPDKCVVGLPGNDQTEWFVGADHTEALYLAVCKVLNIDPDTTT
jgi:hypothetical protein